MKRRDFLPLLAMPCLANMAVPFSFGTDKETYDLVVYGATAGGIIAAISAARAGASVIVLEPSEHIGGMVTGGLGKTDLGTAASIGGMAAEFYRRVKLHYDTPAAWRFQSRDAYLEKQPNCVMEDKWWYHEPAVASKIFAQMLAEVGVQVVVGEQLASVQKRDNRIMSIGCENGSLTCGRVFIDATYEGDLLAQAGVTYRVGRESSAEYGEKFAGVLPPAVSTRKQWDADVSPYGDDGQLSFGVMEIPRGEVGSGDRKVQAYNYRICLTDHPDNRLSIEEPENYDPRRYDLLARYIAAKGIVPLVQSPRGWGLFKVDAIPNRKTDINDGGPFSTDCIGMNWEYPDGNAATRRAILQNHIDFTKGLLYFSGHDARVPESVRAEMQQWGYARDEYPEIGHWTPQLYIREARRMVGAFVMTSHDIETKRVKDDSIGIGSYGADSHLVQRIVEGKVVRNEGNPNDFTPGHNPYEIPYQAITPKRAECDNLLATFCVSASHMAFASIRMEPVFMMISESAGLAAVEAVGADVAVQDVAYSALRPKLEQRRQLVKIDSLRS